MVRRLALVGLLAASWALLAPRANAIENSLAGVRLGQRALDLLDLQGYGAPEFLGPLGSVTTWGIPQSTTPIGGAPAGAYGAAPGMAGSAAAAAPTVTPQTALRGPVPSGASFRFGFSSRARGTTGAATGATTPRYAPAAPIAPSAPAGAAATPAAVAAAGEGGTVYWLYRKPGGVQVVVGISPSGKVNSVVLSGPSYPPAKTEGGVRLGDTYTAVLDKYGFPDGTQNVGANLVLRYANAGLTVTLANMRVQTIALAQYEGALAPTPGRPSAPTRGYGAAARPALPRTAVSGAPASAAAGSTTRPTLRLGFGRRQ
jgi:hypothetical protein